MKLEKYQSIFTPPLPEKMDVDRNRKNRAWERYYNNIRTEALTNLRNVAIPFPEVPSGNIPKIFETAALAFGKHAQGTNYYNEALSIVRKYCRDKNKLADEDVLSAFITSRLSCLEKIKAENGDDWRKILSLSAVFREGTLEIIDRWMQDGQIKPSKELKFLVSMSKELADPSARIFVKQNLLSEILPTKSADRDFRKNHAFGMQFLYQWWGKSYNHSEVFPEETSKIIDTLLTHAVWARKELGDKQFSEYLYCLAQTIGNKSHDPTTIEEQIAKLHKLSLKIYDVCPIQVLLHTSWQANADSKADFSLSVNWVPGNRRLSARINGTIREESRKVTQRFTRLIGETAKTPQMIASTKLIHLGAGIHSSSQGEPEDSVIAFFPNVIKLTSKSRLDILRKTVHDSITVSDSALVRAIICYSFAPHEFKHYIPSPGLEKIKIFLGLANAVEATDALDEVSADTGSAMLTLKQKKYRLQLLAKISEFLYCVQAEKDDPDYYFPGLLCLHILRESGALVLNKEIGVYEINNPRNGLMALAIIGNLLTNTFYLPLKYGELSEKGINKNRKRIKNLITKWKKKACETETELREVLDRHYFPVPRTPVSPQ